MKSTWKTCFHSAWWIGSFIALVGMTSQAVCGQSTADVESEQAREQMVMLTTGRILYGQVSRNAGGYLVEQPNGRLQIPLKDVSFVVNDLHEAYSKQRESVRFPTSASHLALANWCISYRLYDEAHEELDKSLVIDPENDEARRLLERLSDTMRAGQPPAPTKPLPRKTADGFLQPEVESLGGLSRESAMLFTSRIQPLLTNKCGNASCHGAASSNGLHLVSARMGGNGSRQNTERNLAQVMKNIDIEDIENSPLLIMLSKGHGGKGTTFVGKAGSEQIALLRSWAKAVAEEKHANVTQIAKRPSIMGRDPARLAQHPFAAADVKQAAFTDADNDDESSPENPGFTAPRKSIPPRELAIDAAEAEPSELKRQKSRGQSEKPSRKVKETKALDPFDPEIFNRRLR